jgi:hypothetical protein
MSYLGHDACTYLRFHTTAGFPWRTSINSSILGSESFPADSKIRARHMRSDNKTNSNQLEQICFKPMPRMISLLPKIERHCQLKLIAINENSMNQFTKLSSAVQYMNLHHLE